MKIQQAKITFISRKFHEKLKPEKKQFKEATKWLKKNYSRKFF